MPTVTKATENGTATHTAAGTAWEAFAALQADLPTIAFDSENPHFHNRYASLATIVDKVRPLLARHGFSWCATPSIFGDGVVLNYALTWKDSTCVASGAYPLPSGVKPQDLGAAITYARRYAMSAVLGIVTDADDDGEQATKAASAAASRQHPGGAPRTQAQPRTTATNGTGAAAASAPLCAQCAEMGWTSNTGNPPRYYPSRNGGAPQCNGKTADGQYANHRPPVGHVAAPEPGEEQGGQLPWDN